MQGAWSDGLMWYIILFFVTLLLDQVTKIISHATDVNITIIDKILILYFDENPGASFGMLSDKPWAQTFFFVLTVIVLVAGVVFLIWKKPKSKWLLTSMALMFSGTIGNFIDRIAFKFVRDFILLPPFKFNCNVADICLCVGAAMLIFYVLFLDSDPVFKVGKKNKEKEVKKTDE